MITTKKQRRQRRAVKTRAHIRTLGVARLTIHRTAQHIYAQVTDSAGAKVIAAASTVQEKVREGLKGTGNVEAAKAVRPCHRRADEGRGREQGGIRPCRFPIPRARQSARGCGPRSGSRVLKVR